MLQIDINKTQKIIDTAEQISYIDDAKTHLNLYLYIKSDILTEYPELGV